MSDTTWATPPAPRALSWAFLSLPYIQFPRFDSSVSKILSLLSLFSATVISYQDTNDCNSLLTGLSASSDSPRAAREWPQKENSTWCHLQKPHPMMTSHCLKLNPKASSLCSTPRSTWSTLLAHLPKGHSALTNSVFFTLPQTKHFPALGLLQRLFTPPRMLFLQILRQLAFLHHSDVAHVSLLKVSHNTIIHPPRVLTSASCCFLLSTLWNSSLLIHLCSKMYAPQEQDYACLVPSVFPTSAWYIVGPQKHCWMHKWWHEVKDSINMQSVNMMPWLLSRKT
jgi:hypothetical protein